MMRATCLVILVSFLLTCYFGLGYSEVTKDLPQELEIETLKATVETLTKSYNSLCEELQHLSRHVLFHERAIKHIGLQGHHGYGQVIGVGRRRFRERKHRFPLSEHHGSLHNSTLDDNRFHKRNIGLIQDRVRTNGIHAAPAQNVSKIVGEVRILSQSLTPIQANLENTTHTDHSAEGHVHILPIDMGSPNLNPEKDNSTACNPSGPSCSLLRKYSCGKQVNSSKSFDEQYMDWFNLLAGELHVNHLNHQFKNYHHEGHREKSHVSDEDQNDQNDSDANTAEIADEMDKAMKKDDMIYATCQVVPNRHISLILQQNVKGVISLWQRKDGQSPLYVHVNVSGFRVLEAEPLTRSSSPSSGQRRRRETVLMPVERPLEDQPPVAQPLVSLDHGFHVHTNGDLSRSCQSTGMHFNPLNETHGGPMDGVRHLGDLGNLRVDHEGKIDAEYSYPYVSLVGNHSIIGKSLVIHAQSDDFGRNKESESSVSTGNSGPKIACCIIESVDQLPDSSDSPSSINAIQAASDSQSSSDQLQDG